MSNSRRTFVRMLIGNNIACKFYYQVKNLITKTSSWLLIEYETFQFKLIRAKEYKQNTNVNKSALEMQLNDASDAYMYIIWKKEKKQMKIDWNWQR